ncbi:cobalt transporter [Lyngbya aestuarii]|uniref:cobalt transporter n=1 Tax=Lyngbya aestuarii TaxID=118322 RepID=UPI00403D96A2
MKSILLISSILAASLASSTPTVVFAHVGHGDEFQATGGIQRVEVNPETDQLLGIVVTPIAQSAEGGAGVMVPVTALVDANGKQLVFVQYENFYEPVEITTGATKDELIEVTQGLSVGEKLVTQGSLSLYAESRKTQTADVATSSDLSVSPQTNKAHAQADAQGLPHSHDASGNMTEQPREVAPQKSGLPMGILAAVGGGAVLLVGAIAVMGSRKKKSIFSDNKEGF